MRNFRKGGKGPGRKEANESRDAGSQLAKPNSWDTL